MGRRHIRALCKGFACLFIVAGCSAPQISSPPDATGIVAVEGTFGALQGSSIFQHYENYTITGGSIQNSAGQLVEVSAVRRQTYHDCILFTDVKPGTYRLASVGFYWVGLGGASASGSANLAGQERKVPTLVFNVEPGKVIYLGKITVNVGGNRITKFELDAKPEYEMALIKSLAADYQGSPWGPVFTQRLSKLTSN